MSHQLVRVRGGAKVLDDKGVQKQVSVVMKRSTEPLEIQKRREAIEFCRLKVERLIRGFAEESKGRRPSDAAEMEKRTAKMQELYIQCQMLMSLGLLTGMGVLVDCLSFQQRIRRRKDGKKCFRRVPYMDILWDRLQEIKMGVLHEFGEEEIEAAREQIKARTGQDVPREKMNDCYGLINIADSERKIGRAHV